MAYGPRNVAQLSALARALADQGIVAVDDIYSVAELARINTAMDPIFTARSQQARAYVRPDEMLDAGILDWVLSTKMRALIFSIVPDAVLYHLHAYEIAGNSRKSHIFSESWSGWHRDPDSELFSGDPTHVSIFVYLTDVGDSDGAFEFSPHHPDAPLRIDSPVLSMIGPAGMSFVWHRSYYHRASPNRGPRRRRLVKLSVQPNAFPSTHLSHPFFQRVCAELHIGNVEWDLLLGRYQGGIAPKLSVRQTPRVFRLRPTSAIDIPKAMLAGDGRKPVADD